MTKSTLCVLLFSKGKQVSESKEMDKVMYHDWRLVPKHKEEQFKLYNPVPEPPIRYVSYPPLLRAMLLAQRQEDELGAAAEEPTLPLKRDVLLSKEYFRSQEKERERQEETAV
ncbi:28S ribosomal protein S34, mitochondrial-like [Coregonus clupeaformis]|uniref:28S ribosomal protein S34, mitochondrial-like n=1 Tax=Coregonus clupeaformis TaxID=59861 RepID=UPI001BDF9BE0|nr:28S ribosomal protein S34, mitochondrial-like [Coregonus clupeaformis]